MNQKEIRPQDQYSYAGFSFPELCEFDPAEEKDNGWLISFVDILSLLITLFVLLLSFSHLNHQEEAEKIETASAQQASPPPIPAKKSASPVATPTAAPKQMLAIPENIKDMIDVMATANKVNLVIKDDVLFAEGSADLTARGRAVLNGIAEMLNQNEYPVSVEGHTDDVPIHTAQFPSNWELSSYRATNVARYFIQQGVARQRLRAIGYADTHPIADNATEAGRSRNRRVSLVVHVNESTKKSDASEVPAPAKSH